MTEPDGQKLLHAVERLLEDADSIIATVERLKSLVPPGPTAEDETGERVIALYSNRSALSGGATAIPALLPGVGTLTAVAGGALLDMAFMLKFEVEMVLALSHLYGFDIHSEKERQVAFLLASIKTCDVKGGRNLFLDLAEAESTAIWNYAPREAGKLLVTVLSKLVLLTSGRVLSKAIPLVGILVGTGANKILTRQVGYRCREEIRGRRMAEEAEKARGEEVVEAQVVDAEVSA